VNFSILSLTVIVFAATSVELVFTVSVPSSSELRSTPVISYVPSSFIITLSTDTLTLLFDPSLTITESSVAPGSISPFIVAFCDSRVFSVASSSMKFTSDSIIVSTVTS
jgi:hypothetical protein